MRFKIGTLKRSDQFIKFMTKSAAGLMTEINPSFSTMDSTFLVETSLR